jgi:hypothetical protein
MNALDRPKKIFASRPCRYILGKEREKESAWRGSRIKIATIYYCQKWNDTRSILMRNNDINFIFL